MFSLASNHLWRINSSRNVFKLRRREKVFFSARNEGEKANKPARNCVQSINNEAEGWVFGRRRQSRDLTIARRLICLPWRSRASSLQWPAETSSSAVRLFFFNHTVANQNDFLWRKKEGKTNLIPTQFYTAARWLSREEDEEEGREGEQAKEKNFFSGRARTYKKNSKDSMTHFGCSPHSLMYTITYLWDDVNDLRRSRSSSSRATRRKKSFPGFEPKGPKPKAQTRVRREAFYDFAHIDTVCRFVSF